MPRSHVERGSSTRQSRDAIADGVNGLRIGNEGVMDDMHPKKSKDILHKSLDELRAAAIRSRKVFLDLQESFSRETSQIKVYASEQIIDHLWSSKIRMAALNGRSTPIQKKEHSSPKSSSTIDVQAISRTLQERLRDARDSSRMEADRSSKNSSELAEELSNYYRSISRLVHEAFRQYSDMHSLITKLKLLDTFLDCQEVCDKTKGRQCAFARQTPRKRGSYERLRPGASQRGMQDDEDEATRENRYQEDDHEDRGDADLESDDDDHDYGDGGGRSHEPEGM